VTYDNLTTAVAKVLTGTNRQEQEAFVRFRGEFPFDANFAAPRKGNEKGKVENAIKYIRSHAFGFQTEFPTLSASNAYLRSWLLDKDAQRVHSTHKELIFSRYQKEKPHLAPLPKPMPPCCRVVCAKVNKFSFVQFETNRYSVPTAYVYQEVIIKAFEQRILIFKGATLIASHLRGFGRHTEQINPYHFLALLEQKARAVDHAVVMGSFDLDPVFYQLKEALKGVVDNPNRQWIRILRLSETDSMPELVRAVKQALAYGVCDYDAVKNFLLRPVTPTVIRDDPPGLLSHPQLAAMCVEPRSLSRYDALLAGGGKNER
jgi:IS30 family transposase